MRRPPAGLNLIETLVYGALDPRVHGSLIDEAASNAQFPALLSLIRLRTPPAKLKQKYLVKIIHEEDCKIEEHMKQDLVFTRVFDLSVERVWKAWSDPEYVKRWWGPEGFSCPVARMDFREGGRSLVCMRAPKEFGGQDMYSTWTYTKIVPALEIEYLHHFADSDGNRVAPVALGLPPDMPEEVRNAVTFKAVGDTKTEITVTEFDWHVGQMMEMSKMGMEQCLDKMAASFGGTQAPRSSDGNLDCFQERGIG